MNHDLGVLVLSISVGGLVFVFGCLINRIGNALFKIVDALNYIVSDLENIDNAPRRK